MSSNFSCHSLTSSLKESFHLLPNLNSSQKPNSGALLKDILQSQLYSNSFPPREVSWRGSPLSTERLSSNSSFVALFSYTQWTINAYHDRAINRYLVLVFEYLTKIVSVNPHFPRSGWQILDLGNGFYKKQTLSLCL